MYILRTERLRFLQYVSPILPPGWYSWIGRPVQTGKKIIRRETERATTANELFPMKIRKLLGTNSLYARKTRIRLHIAIIREPLNFR